MKRFNRLHAGARGFASPFALLTLVLVPACGTTKATLNASRDLRQRLTALDSFLTETMPGSSTTTIRDREGQNTLIVLVNLSPGNLPRWDLTAPLTRHAEVRDAFYYKAARRISNYVLAKALSPDNILMPRLVLALYTDTDDAITWYNYSYDEVKEPIDPHALLLDPNIEYHS